MRTPAAQHDAPDRCTADQAWLTRSQVDPVLQLEEPLHAVRIHVIRYRRASQGDCLFQNLLDGGVQLQTSARVSRPAMRRGRMPARNRLSSA